LTLVYRNMDNTNNHINHTGTALTAELLRNPGKQVAILIHINPDGDALGSSLGLLNIFRKLGHHCTVISPNDYPGFLKWLPGTEQVIIFRHSPALSIEILKRADIIFAVDFNELKRVKELNEAFELSAAHKVLIDHHPDPDMKVDCLLSDTSVSSTAELVYRFIGDAGLLLYMDNDIASCLYTGIMTDTGCFSYNSSDRKTWEVVAELLGYGIDKDRIYSLTYDNYSSDRMRLLGFSLNEKMEVLPEYHTGFIWLSREDLLKYKFEAGDTEGFVNYPLSIKGIRFSALFIEKEDHVRVSLRSKGSFAVNDLAKKYFNGGGHRNASGGDSFDGLAETVNRFRELLPVYKEILGDYED
jgi:phosphoesterase RecJ-like protein